MSTSHRTCVLFCMLLLGISNLSAQVQFIFHAGMTISTFDRDLMEEVGYIDYYEFLVEEGVNASSDPTNSLRPGAVLGMEMDISLTEKGFLKAGLKYTNMGDSYFFKSPDIQYQGGFTSSDARYIWRPRIDYLAIPINYGTRLGSVSIYGGLTPHFALSSARRYNYYEGSINDIEQVWERDDEYLKSENNILMLNAGANYRMARWDVDQLVSLNIGYTLSKAELVVGDFFQYETGIWNIELSYGIVIGE